MRHQTRLGHTYLPLKVITLNNHYICSYLWLTIIKYLSCIRHVPTIHDSVLIGHIYKLLTYWLSTMKMYVSHSHTMIHIQRTSNVSKLYIYIYISIQFVSHRLWFHSWRLKQQDIKFHSIIKVHNNVLWN